MATYLTKEDRAAQEDADLQAAEAAHEEQFGTPETPTHPDEVVDTGARGTPETQEQPADVDWEKRYKDLQSHHDKQLNELKDKLKEAGVEEDEDEVAKLREEIASLKAKEEQRSTDDAVAQAQEAVASAHPDFVSVISSPEFAEWIKGQPEVYQHAIYDDRPDASLSIDALSLFKMQSGMSQKKSQEAQREMQDLAAQSIGGGHRESPEPGAKKVWTWKEINQLTPQQYDKFEKDIDEALLEGRVR